MEFSKKFKVRNPYKPDEQVAIDVLVSEDLKLDYTNVEWVAIDTEFLNIKLEHDKLCLIQLASPAPSFALDQKLQVELVWVWQNSTAASKLAELLQREDLEVIMHVSTADMPRIERFTGVEFKGKLYDTKVASRVAITNLNQYNMAELVTQFLDPRFNKDKAISISQWDTPPTIWEDKVIEYAMNDVIYLHALKRAITEIAERRGKLQLVNETMAIMPTVCKLVAAGYDEKILTY
jgi:ribonuclease D